MYTHKIGIIQGRLTPPKGRGIQFFSFNEWIEEFKKTVSLGKGNANFPKLFSALKKISYSGDFTLQAARGKEGVEEENVKK
jgi:sugar phosphate isomerase/epimerase